MNFKTMLEEDQNVFFDDEEFGETAMYNGKEITIVESSLTKRALEVPGMIMPSASVLIRSSEVPSPKEGDTVVYQGQTWQVAPYFIKDGDLWSINLTGELQNQMVGL